MHRTLVVFPALVLAFASLAPAPLSGQAPRAPDGRPDLQGVWDFRTATPVERPKEFTGKEFFTPEEAAEFERRAAERIGNTVAVHAPGWLDYGAKVLPDLRTSLIVDPPDGRVPPLTPGAQKRSAARAAGRRGAADGPEDFGLGERCILFSAGPPLVPGPYNNNIQIVQTSGAVLIYLSFLSLPLDRRLALIEVHPQRAAASVVVPSRDAVAGVERLGRLSE